MAIAEMRRVTIIGHHSVARELTDALQNLGSVQVTVFGTDLGEDDKCALACPLDHGPEISKLDGAISELKYVIDFMDRYNRVSKTLLENFIGYRMPMTKEDFVRYTEDAGSSSRVLFERARGYEERLAQISAAEAEAKAEIEALSPWTGLKSSLKHIGKGRYVTITAGTVEAKDLDTAMRRIAAEIEGFCWESHGVAGKRANVLVTYPSSEETKVTDALAGLGFARVALDKYSMAPGEEVERLKSVIAAAEARRDQLIAEVVAFTEERPKVFALFDHLSQVRERLSVFSDFGGTKSTVVIEGWAKAVDLPVVRKRLAAVSEDAVLMDRPAKPDENPPVDLINGPLTYPFEVVTRVMGLPKPGGIDPTPFLAPFFFVFFGMCLADATYGLALAAIGYLLLKKIKATGMGRQLLYLLIAGGLGTFVMGVLFGGYFGDLFAKVLGVRPLWFDPLENPMMLLTFAFALGVIQIFFGLIIKAVYNIQHGQALAALYDQGFWIILLASLGLMLGGASLGPAVAEGAKYGALLGTIGLVTTQGRHHKNPVMRLGSGILSLYNVTGYLSDVVSYSRLFGLGFTSIVVGMVVNDLALRPFGLPLIGPVITLVILVIGHVFNLLINVTGAYIHSSRLQYVEFFGKFYESGGKRFLPFRKSTKYVDLDIAEEA